MASFPIYEQRTQVATQGQSYAPQPALNNNAVGDSFARASAGLGDVATGEAHIEREKALLVKHQQEEDGRAWAGNAVSDLTIKMHGLFEDSKSSAKDAASGFVTDYLSKFDDTTKAAIEMAPTPAAKKFLTAHVQSLRSQLGNAAIGFEAGAQRAWRVDQYSKSGDNLAAAAAANPGQVAMSLELLQQTLPDVGPEREKLYEAERKKVTSAAAGTSIQRDPGGTLRLINQALNIPTPVLPSPMAIARAVDSAPSQLQSLISAIFQQESNSGAVDTTQPNYAGARGPMQVTEPTFEGMKAKGMIPKDYRWDNPDHTTEAGMVLIKSLWEKYQGDPSKTAAAYYGGPKAVNADGTLADFGDLKNSKAPTVKQYAAAVVARMGVGQTEQIPLTPLQPVALTEGYQTTKTGLAWVDSMKPDELLHYRQQAYTEMQRTSSVARQGLEATERDMQAEALAGIVRTTGIPTQEQYVAAFGPVDGALRYRQNVSNTIGVARSIQALQTASPQERQAILSASKPMNPGPGFADQQTKYAHMVQASQIIDQQLRTDPVMYVSRNSPRVRGAFDALNQLPPDATPEQRRAATDRYATESLAEQRRLGAPSPQLLTDDQAAKIAMRFSDQKEGGLNAAALMEQLQQQWGSHFPTVFQQLQKDNKLPGDAVVIPQMKDAASKERLARLAGTSDDALKAMLPTGAYKDLTESILSVAEPLRRTLLLQGGGPAVYEKNRKAIERLAMNYRAGGVGAKDAASQAFEEVAGHAYQFESTYRVPKTEMPAQVIDGVRALRYRVEELPIMVPPAPAGMKPEEHQRQYLSSVRSNAVFVTNADESGVLMYAQSQSGLMQVLGPAGKQISFTWKQLRDEAAAANSVKAVQVGGR